MAITVTHAFVGTAADDPEAEINKAEWNADHTIVGSSLTGTNGGAAAAGGSFTIAGGTGDAGADAGAALIVGGGSGAGSAGAITVTGALKSDGSAPSTLVLTDTDVNMTGGEGGTGESGGSLTITAGRGNTTTEAAANFVLSGNTDAGAGGNFEARGGGGETGQAGGYAYLAGGTGAAESDSPASITTMGGDGAGNPGVVYVTSAGVNFTLKQAAYCNPASTTAGDIATALINAGLMAAS